MSRAPVAASVSPAVIVGLPLAVVLLAGCPYTEPDFRYEADRATCRWAEECGLGGGLGFDECMEESEAAWTDPDPSCDFDPTAARSCVAGLRQLECPEGEEIPGFPSACERVWVGCDEPEG